MRAALRSVTTTTSPRAASARQGPMCALLFARGCWRGELLLQIETRRSAVSTSYRCDAGAARPTDAASRRERRRLWERGVVSRDDADQSLSVRKGASSPCAYSGRSSRPSKIEVKGETMFWVLAAPPKSWNVMADPGAFYDNPGKTSMSPDALITRFKSGQGSFYRDLSLLPESRPTFNPIREHERRRQP